MSGDLLDFYYQQALSSRSKTAWLAKMQEEALADFARMGFPDRKDEDWKYTQPLPYLKKEFSQASADAPQHVYRSDAPIEAQIPIVNGQSLGFDALPAAFDNMIICPLLEAIERYPEKVKAHLNSSFSHREGLQALNTAMLSQGLFIYLPENCHIDLPLLLAHWQDQPNQAVYLHHLIVLEKNARLTLLEDYAGADERDYFSHCLTEVILAENAEMTHYKIQREAKSALHIADLTVKQAKDSEFHSHSLSLGGAMVRSDVHIGLHASGASCTMNGIYVPTGKQHIDHHTRVDHFEPDCHSRQDYKGILSDHAHAVFNGQVFVAKDAQHTQAEQQNKNLLLSKHAAVDTKPQLDIYADDVRCSHGATVGQLDEEALFYLSSRGLDKASASAMLIESFAGQNIQWITDETIALWVKQLIQQKLGYAHG